MAFLKPFLYSGHVHEVVLFHPADDLIDRLHMVQFDPIQLFGFGSQTAGPQNANGLGLFFEAVEVLDELVHVFFGQLFLEGKPEAVGQRSVLLQLPIPDVEDDHFHFDVT